MLIQADYALGYREDRPLRCEPWPAQGWSVRREVSDWTEHELATLAELAETFVRGDARRRARLVTEAIERAADPAQVRQFHRLLGLMESRWANLLSPAGRLRSRRCRRTRENGTCLWSTSPLAFRRTAFSTLRRLMTFLAHADPGVDASGNPRHAVIGYEPEWPPVTSEPTPTGRTRSPLDQGADDEPTGLGADVVVAGSGAGGGVGGRSCRGGAVGRRARGRAVRRRGVDAHDELDAYARLYLNHGLLSTWDASVMMLAGSGVGGGTLVNWMTSVEAPAAVREEWAVDHGIDQLADGEAWTDDIATLEDELSVTPAPRLPPKDVVIVNGAERLGWEVGPTRRYATDCHDCGKLPVRLPARDEAVGHPGPHSPRLRSRRGIVPQVRVTRVLVERPRARRGRQRVGARHAPSRASAGWWSVPVRSCCRQEGFARRRSSRRRASVITP